MRPVIKYISFYDFADSGIARNYSVAAANKMDYIIESLVRIGYDVEVVSVSACIESGTFRWYKSRVEERQPHVKTRFIIRKTKCSSVLKQNVLFYKTKRTYVNLFSYPNWHKKAPKKYAFFGAFLFGHITPKTRTNI